MNLRKQLFFTLLVCSALLVAVLFAINAWSFSRGFSDYLAKDRLSPLIQELSQKFEEQGSWEWIDSEGMVAVRAPGRPQVPLAWLRIIDQTVQTSRQGITTSQDVVINAEAHHGENRREHNKGRSTENNERRDQRPRQDSLRRAGRIAVSLVLANADKKLLVGNLSANAVDWLPIKVDEKVTGFVGYRKSEELDGFLNHAFLKQQTRSFAIVAAALALISAVLSMPLASRLVRPIDSISTAVGRIRDGQYATRIDSQRRDELGELASNINAMAKSLESNQQARQRWVAEISHELRTPLAVLQGELEAVEDNIRPMNSETVSGLLAQTARLSRLVDDLHVLSMSDLGALDYRFVRMNPALIVAEVLDEYSEQLTSSGITLDSSMQGDLPDMNIDQQRFRQLLNNLVQNTLGYTNSSGSLHVSLESVAARTVEDRNMVPIAPGKDDLENLLLLRWSDSEPGVTDEQLKQLFEPLFRTEASRSRRTGGSGLGLSIVQKIVEAHGGKINADHSGKGGLQLTLTFPPAGG